MHELINKVIDEFRLPEFLPDRCVHSQSETATCRACVDICPQDAWMLDDEQLGIIPERCDGCGLCVPACTEAAIQSEFEPLTGIRGNLKLSLMACTQSLSRSSGKGVLSCLHTMGLHDLLSFYRQGSRSLFFLHEDCDQCFRGKGIRVQDRIKQLNSLLSQRNLPEFKIRRLTKTRWLSLQKEIKQFSKQPVTRRNFLRKIAADVAEKSLDSTVSKKTSQPEYLSPGKLLPARNNNDQRFYFPEININKCNACHACVRLCPHDAIRLDEEIERYEISADNCTGCKLCVDSCDQSAINVAFWRIPQSISIQLRENICSACGVTFFSTVKNHSDGYLNYCAICSKTNHSSNLFQVLN
ncbi:MAG TPA: 4Fe-4S dicluster domain-containing protein [Chromatiales bacterium]|nr:4Fe-4S dicluster domain-containing protein [Chromatiales bacterium]